MRVVHLSPATFGSAGTFGGGERYALELARHMADVVPTRLLTFSERPFREKVGKLEVIAIGPPWHVRRQVNNPVHPGIARQVGWADVLHCHQRFILAASLTAGLCRLTGRRVFVTDHGGGGWDPTARLGMDPFHGWLHQSRFARQVYGHDNAPTARVIYGGVDIKKFSPDPTVAKEPLVVYVGRLLPHKGINYLIEALPEGMSLALVGRPYDDQFYAELKRMAVGRQVHFRHEGSDAEIIKEYRRAACVVLPSVYRTMYGLESKVPELLGQTLLEGMACGTPGVCTAVASLPEVIEDGVTGFVVPANDAGALRARLEWIRDHPGEALRMGRSGRERVLRQFTWPAVVQQCLAAYAAI